MAWASIVSAGGGGGASTISGVTGLQVALDSKVALPVVVPVTTATYTATDVDLAIEVDSTAQAVTVTLPATCTSSRRYSVLWRAGANPVTVVSSSGARLIVQEDGSLAASATLSVVGEVLTYYASTGRFQRT